MITFFVYYVILLLLSSIFILGWYEITRGYYIIQPDNSKKYVGEIFGFWELFWERIISYKRIYYTGEALKEKNAFLKQMLPKIYDKLSLNCKARSNDCLSDKEYSDFVNVLHCEIDENGLWYIEEPNYRFPEWIRKPISSCPTCMASVYGTMLFFSINSLSKFELFNIFEYKVLSIFVFWIFFIVILSRLDTFFHQKMQ